MPDARGAARVSRTGIALVHQGELVLPAPGSEAQAELVLDDARTVVHYHFPVEVEVRATSQAVDVEAIVQETLRRLAAQLENR
jgi:hypothetical protein